MDIKIGDVLFIPKRPRVWNDSAGGICPLTNSEESDYPMIVTVDKIETNTHTGILANSFGWSKNAIIKMEGFKILSSKNKSYEL